jgi:transposase
VKNPVRRFSRGAFCEILEIFGGEIKFCKNEIEQKRMDGAATNFTKGHNWQKQPQKRSNWQGEKYCF